MGFFQFWIFWPMWPLCWVLGHFNSLDLYVKLKPICYFPLVKEGILISRVHVRKQIFFSFKFFIQAWTLVHVLVSWLYLIRAHMDGFLYNDTNLILTMWTRNSKRHFDASECLWIQIQLHINFRLNIMNSDVDTRVQFYAYNQTWYWHWRYWVRSV